MHRTEHSAHSALINAAHQRACTQRNFNVALTTAQSMRTVPMPRYIRPHTTVHTRKPLAAWQICGLATVGALCGASLCVLVFALVDQLLTLALR